MRPHLSVVEAPSAWYFVTAALAIGHPRVPHAMPSDRTEGGPARGGAADVQWSLIAHRSLYLEDYHDSLHLSLEKRRHRKVDSLVQGHPAGGEGSREWSPLPQVPPCHHPLPTYSPQPELAWPSVQAWSDAPARGVDGTLLGWVGGSPLLVYSDENMGEGGKRPDT